MRITTLQKGKRLVKIVFSLTLLITGVAMLVLPGPGIVAISVALAVLGGEFTWARRLLDQIKVGARRVRVAISQRPPTSV